MHSGKTTHVHGFKELTLLKYTYCPNQSTDSVQSLWKYHKILHKSPKTLYGTAKPPQDQKPP
jgi:hypothetical protein